jgi:hypothetical protein
MASGDYRTGWLDASAMGCTRREWEEMASWCDTHFTDPRVMAWLERNPPPLMWRGTPLEWAYTEMPVWVLWNKP